MRLQFEASPAIDDPAPDQLADGLRGLRLPDNSFAILDSGPASYLQVAAGGGDDYLVEYQEGSVDRHYQAPAAMPLDQVTELFLSYLRGDDAWRTAVRWTHLPLGRSAPAAGARGRRSRPHQAAALGNRPRGGGARPAPSERTPAGLVILYAILIPVALIFAAVMLRTGIGGGLASLGIVGEPGRVLVTSCQPSGRTVSCSGVFIRPGGAIAPITVPIEGSYSPAQIRSQRRIPVHLLGGDAWPDGMAAAGDWVIPLGWGCLFVVAFGVGAVGTLRHWLGRLAGRGSPRA